MPLDLIREPLNIYDSNAVAVYCSGRKIGYLSRKDAVEVAPVIDSGIPVNGVIEWITGGGKYNYGCNIRVRIYKKNQPLLPTVENIDKSNPLYGKTCVLFHRSAYNDEQQNIINLGGVLRHKVSGKTDYYIVDDFKIFYACATNDVNKAKELMQNGGKIQLLSSEEYSKIKEKYLPK